MGKQDGLVERCVRSLFTAATIALVSACGDAISAGDPSVFTADVSGTRTGRLNGSATAGSDWSREMVVSATLPNGAGPITSIALVSAGGENVISFTRQGAGLSAGTYQLGPASAVGRVPVTFSSAYVVRRAEGLQIFRADSGTMTIFESGNRVTGSFTVHASRYIVIPHLRKEDLGKPITPLSSGEETVAISGTFDAARR